MPSDDLSAHARSSENFYDLLQVREGATESEIKKAYRKTALRYHPDKNPGLDAVEKFHKLQIAYDVLCDATARATYDAGRKARWEKEQRERAYSDNRRRLKEDLERAERGEKRMRQEDIEEDQLMREARRIAAINKQKREDAAARLRKEEEQAQAKVEEEAAPPVQQTNGGEIGDMDRAVRIRWMGSEGGAIASKDDVAAALQRFGEIDSIIMLKDKVKSNGKRVMRSAAVIFKSMASADSAIAGSDKVAIPGLKEVAWFKGEPQALKDLKTRYGGSDASLPSTPKTRPGSDAAGTPGLSTADIATIRLRLASQRLKQAGDDGLKKVPSFGSFKDIRTPDRPIGSNPMTPGSMRSPALDKKRQEERQRLVEALRDEES